MKKEEGPELSKWVTENPPLVVALLVTAVVLMIVAGLAHGYGDLSGEPVKRWDWFFRLAPNEMGDSVAGIFAGLTLVWIVASVFHQSRELRAQREEFKKMVEAQDAQVEALNAQAEIFRDEKHRRDQDINRQYIGRLVKSTVATIKYSRYLSIAWRPILQVTDNSSEFLSHWSLVSTSAPPSETEDAFLLYAREIITSSKKLSSLMILQNVVLTDLNADHLDEDRDQGFREEIIRIVNLCQEAVDAKRNSSTIEQELLSHLRMEELLASVKSVQDVFRERFN